MLGRFWESREPLGRYRLPIHDRNATKYTAEEALNDSRIDSQACFPNWAIGLLEHLEPFRLQQEILDQASLGKEEIYGQAKNVHVGLIFRHKRKLQCSSKWSAR